MGVRLINMEARSGGVRLNLAPLHQIDVASTDTTTFVSQGEDPQFDVACESGVGRLAPGWYLLSVRVEVIDGFVVAPCLYPDYGEGPSEATRIDLPEPDRDGRIRAVVVIAGRLRSLRFDPTIHRARFRLIEPRLDRISRAQAAWAMCAAIARRSPEGRRAGITAGRRLLGSALRGRAAIGAAELVSRYQQLHRQGDRGYAEWLRMFAGAAADPDLPAGLVPSATRQAPLFSILLPVCDTPPRLLDACIRSVLAQTCADWELCIADDASTDPATRRMLEAHAAADARIRFVRGECRAGISGNTNRALAAATGRFVGFLDHDDELAPDALQEVAAAIGCHPDARLFYTDEDKIDESGQRFAPHFKPAWNPDLLRSLNYIAHFLVVDAELVRAVGGLRSECDGSQDHDLALRCIERLGHGQIVHIPKVLYHWRTVAGSTALGVGQKAYALEAGRRAIADHLARTGHAADVHLLADGRYRVERHLPVEPPHVAVVIPTRDRLDLLRTCIDGVLGNTRYPSFEILVVDNGSTDPETLAYLEQVVRAGKVSVLPYPAPFNFSAIVNRGVRATASDVVCLLNNDIVPINADWLREMVSQSLRAKVGVVGSMLYYPDDTIQHAGVILGMGGVAGHSHVRMRRGSDGYLSRARVVQNLTAVTGACMVFRREVFDAVDGFDEQLPVAFNDIDFCMRVHARGHFNVWTPFAELYHHESASRGHEDTPAKQARFALEAAFMRHRWGDALAHDPYYNPNLSLDSECFELAFPPREPASRTRQLPLRTAA